MINKINSQANIQSMLQTLRAHQAQAGGDLDAKPSTGATGQVDFGKSIESVIKQVNELQVKSDRMMESYERGEDIPLTDVVLSMQKASLGFEATLQVRNKVMKAYEDILNMPV